MLEAVSPARRARVGRYRFLPDKKAGIYSEVLVRCLLSAESGVPYGAVALETGDWGKPYAPGLPGCHFSISHTRGALAVCLSDAAVGVDIERLREADAAVAERFFTERERLWLKEDAADFNRRFFEIWTRKEALLKRDGRGLSAGLKRFDATEDAPDGVLSTFGYKEYILSVCAGEAARPERLTTFDETELISRWRRSAG
jgi:4'-phosphopantetheinyl transferase